MATVICMDGLGGHPEVTFGELKIELERGGHKVVYAEVEGINSHDERIQRIVDAFYKERFTAQDKIFLVGQSAGGGALRSAAKVLSRRNEEVSGVILLSPSMPRFEWFMTKPLAKCILRHLWRLFLAQDINSTQEQYESIIDPVAAELKTKVIENRLALPGRESRTLAFWPPPLTCYSYRTLYVYAEHDNWIATSAHKRLCLKLSKLVPSFTEYEVLGSGHITLLSEKRSEVISKIVNWIQNK
jgi:pimeloyl-ACP methyl ester carboxylesterase